MKKLLAYIILPLILLALSPGVDTMQMLLDKGGDPARAWIMFVPSTLVYLALIFLFNDKLLIPKLLLKGRFARYILAASGVVVILSLLVAGSETWVRGHFDLPSRVESDSLVWIVVDVASNLLFWVPLMVAIALLRLYGRWKEDMASEERLSAELERYMANVRECLNPEVIFESLRQIAEAIRSDAEEASERIGQLSEYLRAQLAAIVPPPMIAAVAYDASLFSRLTAVLVDRRYRWLRHLLLIMELVAVSFIAYSHEYLVDVGSGLLQSAWLVVYLGALTYIDLLLFKRYERHGSMRKLVVGVALLFVVFVSPVVVGVAALIDEIGVFWPAVIEVAAIGAGVVGIGLYLCGVNALLLFQNWIRAQRHITLLRAETLRQEYLFLRKQINPHFLFNVLNSIEISAYDSPDLASDLLQDLVKLLRYQFEEGRRDTTSLRDEVEFLRSYLALEESRRDQFAYEIELRDAVEATVPTLLFLPIVENAAKYSPRHRVEGVNVKVAFRVEEGWLRFECRNPYDAELVAHASHHGIGLENTRRRLELIYEGRARLTARQTDREFCVEIALPI